MKTSPQLVVLLLFITAGAHVTAARQANRSPQNPSSATPPTASGAQDDMAKHAEAY